MNWDDEYICDRVHNCRLIVFGVMGLITGFGLVSAAWTIIGPF